MFILLVGLKFEHFHIDLKATTDFILMNAIVATNVKNNCEVQNIESILDILVRLHRARTSVKENDLRSEIIHNTAMAAKFSARRNRLSTHSCLVGD